MAMYSYFDNRFYNPQFFNPQYYQQMQNPIFTTQEQSERVVKAMNAFHDMMDAVDGMDQTHQEQTIMLCIAEMARRRRW